jgi:beta-lactamase superfamily II metal-dependent hydrolase
MPSFAGYPSAFLREEPGSRKKVEQLLWGDYLNVLGPERDGWLQVRARGTTGWIDRATVAEERLLEVNFVDIGQGDGCFIVTPDDRFIIVDAGEGDNMFRFLRWRFNLTQYPDRVVRVAAAVITHPDMDHYRGFKQLFDSRHFAFGTVYHNGVVERTGGALLGPTEREGMRSYLTGVVADRAALDAIIGDGALVGRKLYPALLRSAATGGRVNDVRMLCADDGHLPGYDGQQPAAGNGPRLSIQVLAPVPEPDAAGARRLRTFGDPGKTKNGHSVVLMLRYGDVRVLLGGDLNVPAEHYLLKHYTGMDPETDSEAGREALVERAREVFEADFAKACHHGSADFTSLFLRAVNAVATIVSSGDDEPHCHPRPDALGALGRHGRGDRPLLFSTELARSARERIKDPYALRATIEELYSLREATEDGQARAEIDERIKKALGMLDRSVAVYGMINLRTDGVRAIVAQKLESPRSGTGEKWDVHRFEPGDGGRLRYRSEHAR